jgi:hypothetical protein
VKVAQIVDLRAAGTLRVLAVADWVDLIAFCFSAFRPLR